MSNETAAAFGNACHAITSALILAYTTATFLFAHRGSAVFDEAWLEHGFCVVQLDVPYQNSHDLCLYADSILVALGLLLYRSLRGVPTPEMKYSDEMMRLNMLGHLAHGVAHGFFGAKIRSGDYAGARHASTGVERLLSMKEEGGQIKTIVNILVVVLFWISMLKGILPKLSAKRVVLLAVLVYAGGLFVKDVLSFAYVQAVLTVASVSTQMMLPREEKHFAYAAFAASSVPLSIIPWIESTRCQDLASKLGGHLMYDVAIPIFLTAAYYLSWRHYSVMNEEKVAKLL